MLHPPFRLHNFTLIFHLSLFSSFLFVKRTNEHKNALKFPPLLKLVSHLLLSRRFSMFQITTVMCWEYLLTFCFTSVWKCTVHKFTICLYFPFLPSFMFTLQPACQKSLKRYVSIYKLSQYYFLLRNRLFFTCPMKVSGYQYLFCSLNHRVKLRSCTQRPFS